MWMVKTTSIQNAYECRKFVGFYRIILCRQFNTLWKRKIKKKNEGKVVIEGEIFLPNFNNFSHVFKDG
jgi:hypothetical protein